MKAFRVSFNCPGMLGNEVVICEKKENAIDILCDKYNCNVKVESIHEVSLNSVYVKNLTAGDLLRLIGKGE